MCSTNSHDFSIKMLKAFLKKYDVDTSGKIQELQQKATLLKKKINMPWIQIFNIEEIQAARDLDNVCL